MSVVPRRAIAEAQIGPLGLGCMGVSSTYATADEATSLKAIHTALDLGMSMLDTADLYGSGHNERLLKTVLNIRRDEVFLATKYGFRFRGEAGAKDRYVDSSALWTRQACDASLQRLGVDRIDLYYLHRRNPQTPIEETMDALGALVDAGKIAHIGLSEVSPATLRAAATVRHVDAVQMEYSLFTRDVEAEMLRTCRQLGTTLVAYAPIGRGLLTGAVSDRRSLQQGDARLGHPRFGEQALEDNLRLVDEVRGVAAEIDATPAQVALAWLLAQGSDVVPIPGTTREAHVRANAASTRIKLMPEHLARLDRIFPVGAAQGDRHDKANLRMLGN